MMAVSIVEIRKELKIENNDDKNKTILIFGGTSKFYYVHNDDTFMLNYLLGYKIIPKLKLSFLDSALNKTMFHLQSFNISCKVIRKKLNL